MYLNVLRFAARPQRIERLLGTTEMFESIQRLKLINESEEMRDYVTVVGRDRVAQINDMSLDEMTRVADTPRGTERDDAASQLLVIMQAVACLRAIQEIVDQERKDGTFRRTAKELVDMACALASKIGHELSPVVKRFVERVVKAFVGNGR